MYSARRGLPTSRSSCCVAELIREAAIRRTFQEVPHAVEVVVEELERAARGPRARAGLDLGRERVAEGDPDRRRRAHDQGDRQSPRDASSSARSGAGSTSTCRCGCAATGAPTRACSTGSGSTRRRAPPQAARELRARCRCERVARSSRASHTNGHRDHLEVAAAQARDLVVLEARAIVDRARGVRRARAALELAAAGLRRCGRRVAVERRDAPQLRGAEAPRQQRVDDHRRRARARAASRAPPAARSSRSPPSRCPAPRRRRRCAPGRRAARAPCASAPRPGRRARSRRTCRASAACRARARSRARRGPPGRSRAARRCQRRCWVSSQTFTIPNSSFAPGAAAAKYWNVPLEASIRPGTRPPSSCTHSSSARSGSIVRLERPSCERRLRARAGAHAEQLGEPALVADLHDDRRAVPRAPRAGRSRPRSWSCRRRPCR